MKWEYENQNYWRNVVTENDNNRGNQANVDVKDKLKSQHVEKQPNYPLYLSLPSNNRQGLSKRRRTRITNHIEGGIPVMQTLKGSTSHVKRDCCFS